MSRTGSRIAFLTVTDYDFAVGTIATVNSIRKFHYDASIIVVNNQNRPLTSHQADILAKGRVQLINSSHFAKGGRYVGPWELKAYAACDLADSYDLIIGIDSDCVLCSNVDDAIQQALTSGRFIGGADGGAIEYDEAYLSYGIASGAVNNAYMSTSLYFCPTTAVNRRVLQRWAACVDKAVFNGRGEYPGHGDQGILNAVLFSQPEAAAAEILPNEVWSQHWTYWDDVIAFLHNDFANCSRHRTRQRTFHCGGAEKFWAKEHSNRVLSSNPSQATNYAWWLYLFWFGDCRDWSIDPTLYIPEESHHLFRDLVNFFGPMRKFDPSLTLWKEGATGLLSRLVQDIRGCMSFNGSMEDYVEIVRTLPEGAKIAEVGSCEGRSIVSLALTCLDRDYTFYSVESFTGDLNNTFDGHELPSPERYLRNVKQRYPFLKINCILERSEDASCGFADGSLDAVFIDACHSEEAVRHDIEVWMPKLKRGGIIFGDDWCWESVRAGVYSVFAPDHVQASINGHLWQVHL